jgi:hypothetical protein
MNDLDAVEKITSKIFEIKQDLKENDYLELMNICKELNEYKEPKIPHRIYFSITTSYSVENKAEIFRNSFYLRALGKVEINEIAKYNNNESYLYNNLIENGFILRDMRQIQAFSYYISNHIKELSEIIDSESVVESVTVNDTVIEPYFVRKERENEDYDTYPLNIEMDI